MRDGRFFSVHPDILSQLSPAEQAMYVRFRCLSTDEHESSLRQKTSFLYPLSGDNSTYRGIIGRA